MSQSSSKSNVSGARKQNCGGEEGSSKEKPDNFVWTDDEVQFLLKVTGEFKANKEMENIDSNEMFLKPAQSHVQSFVCSKKFKYFLLVVASFSKSSVFVCLHETGVTENDIVFKFFHFGERFQIFPESPKTIPSFSSFPCKQEAKTEKYFCGFVDSSLV